jgi:glycosyltransferase involved in cell wall biosynthesis
MKLEVLVSTMHRQNIDLVEKMRIDTDALIINQCNNNNYTERQFDNNLVRMLSVRERGLSKSRNLAIKNSIADICVIADDDLRYNNGYENIILEAYKKYQDAAVIAFDVPSTNKDRPTSTLKEGKVGFLKSMKIASFQITFNKRYFSNDSHLFNEHFGAGSVYTSGEENIFLANVIKSKMKVYFVNKEIATVDHDESTWFNGFDITLFKTKGAMFYELSRSYSFLLILQFAIRKHKLYKHNISFIKAISYMISGKKEYKNIKQ